MWGDLRIFLTCSDRESGTRYVLWRERGRRPATVWKGRRIQIASLQPTPSPDNNYASSTPAVDEKTRLHRIVHA